MCETPKLARASRTLVPAHEEGRDKSSDAEVIWGPLDSQEAWNKHHDEPYGYQGICRLPKSPHG